MSKDVAVDIRGVSKRFGSVTALDNVSLAIEDQEFFTLLGPSGCGKTTLLRIIAGFESVSDGEVHLHGKEIENLPANLRPVNTVFQQYSLFPHMTVEDNIKFGLQMKGVDSNTVNKRCAAMLELVQLQDFAKRKSTQLSGGQQQRVALARALAPEPEVLLLDEPLSALDLKLRQAMRVELKQIQEETGITFIFVTHDQEEALTMSDRIAVMSAGKVQQIGTSHEIYQSPDNQFVADFIGESNLLHCKVSSAESSTNFGHPVICELEGIGTLPALSNRRVETGSRGKLCIRPERLGITTNISNDALLKGNVKRLVYLGTDTQVLVTLNSGQDLIVRVQNADGESTALSEGQAVAINVDQDATRFLLD